MPNVLVSDELSPRAVEIFRERGIDVDFKPGLKPDELKQIIGKYDGLAIRSSTKVTKELLEHALALKVIGRAGIGVDNVDVPAASGTRCRGDEHAIRQFDHHRRTCDRDVVRAGPRHSASQPVDPCRQVGEVPLHGRRTVRQSAGRDRRRQYRLDRRRPRAWAEDESDRLRSLPRRRTRPRSRRGESRARRSVRARRFHHLARAVDRPDAQRAQRRESRQDQEGRAHHQLRARRTY